MTFSEKYIIPMNRFPKPFNQNIVDGKGKIITNVGSCVACTFTKILEVINHIKTGEYVELSKGYMYGRNNYPNKRNQGMSEEYTLNAMLKRGTVPLSMCTDYAEFPDIAEILNKRADISILDKKAEKYALKAWENLSCNNEKDRFAKIKEYLHKYNMPIAGTIKSYKGEKHSVVIIGYEDDYILFLDHTGGSEVEKLKYDRFSKAYYLDGGIEVVKKMPFVDVKETDWFYEAVKAVYDSGIMNGTSANTFSPYKSLTRAEMAVIIHRLMKRGGVK